MNGGEAFAHLGNWNRAGWVSFGLGLHARS